MLTQSILDVEKNEVLLPWRGFEFPPLQIVAITAIIVALVGVAYFIEGKDVWSFLVGGAAMLVFVPSGLLLARYLLTKWPLVSPLAIDQNRMVAQSVWSGGLYIAWADVYAIAHVHWLRGHGIDPVEFNLLVYKRNGESCRVSLPRMSNEEQFKFLIILENIARLHQIELVFDDSDAGKRRIRYLPKV